MTHFNFSSGDEYANALINDMQIIKGGIPEDLMDYWCIEIRELCNSKFFKYIEGEEETYMLSDIELEQTFKTASEKLIGDTLGDLVDKGMVKMSIDGDGEVRYQATDEGKKWADAQ